MVEGRVVYVHDDRIPFKEMVKGSYFGECDIIFQRKRLHTARALTDAHTLSLSKQIFESLVCTEYPEVYEEMRKIAKERDRRFLEAEQVMLKYIEERGNDIETIFDDSDTEGLPKKRRLRRLYRRSGKIDASEAELGNRSDVFASSVISASQDGEESKHGYRPQYEEEKKKDSDKNLQGSTALDMISPSKNTTKISRTNLGFSDETKKNKCDSTKNIANERPILAELEKDENDPFLGNDYTGKLSYIRENLRENSIKQKEFEEKLDKVMNQLDEMMKKNIPKDEDTKNINFV